MVAATRRLARWRSGVQVNRVLDPDQSRKFNDVAAHTVRLRSREAPTGIGLY
jgi:hypothetical protein